MKDNLILILGVILVILIVFLPLTDELEEEFDRGREEGYEEGRLEGYEEGREYGYEEGYDEGYYDGHEEGCEEGYEDGYSVGYDDCCYDYDIEGILNYYDGLCNKYGYLTYDRVMHQNKYNTYAVQSTQTYHKDWLCPFFDHELSYTCTAASDFFFGYSPCELCSNSYVFYYLDENTGVFHAAEFHLDKGTDDYISPHVQYRMVSYDAAVFAGYTPCPECGERYDPPVP